MSDYGQIIIDLTGVTANSDVNLSIQISGSNFAFGKQQDLSFEGISGVTGISVGQTVVKLAVPAGTTLGGLLTIYGTVGGASVGLTVNAADFSTSGSKAFDVTWSSTSPNNEGNLISGGLTLGNFTNAS